MFSWRILRGPSTHWGNAMTHIGLLREQFFFQEQRRLRGVSSGHDMEYRKLAKIQLADDDVDDALARNCRIFRIRRLAHANFDDEK